MILIIYILTPFTMTHSIHLFQGFRIIQTRMMVLAVIHGLRPNQKLKSILEGCTNLTHLWGSNTPRSQPFFQTIFPIPECLHSFHSYHEHAAQVLCWVRHASHP